MQRYCLGWKTLIIVALIVAPRLWAGGAHISPLSRSRQALVVTTMDWNDLHGTAQRYERKADGNWAPIGPTFPVVVGKTGLGWGRGIHPAGIPTDGPIKKEGDGKAPAGVFLLPRAFGYDPGPLEGFHLSYFPLTVNSECVDDSHSSHYNELLDNRGVTKDWNSSETMLRSDDLYHWGVYVAHNASPAQPGSGSCIFLHIWSGQDIGTVGCTAMQQTDIVSLLRWLDPLKRPVLVQMPQAEYRKLRGTWELP
jgi:D-alanyl-D-alanine dipeptidase